MPVTITVRNVPEEVRDELASRAALAQKSMQQYLLTELERMAARPTVERWLQEVRERKEAAGTRLSSRTILRYRDADRR